MTLDQLVKPGHVLAVDHERDLMRVGGVSHDLLNAPELGFLEYMGGRIEVEGHQLSARAGNLGLVLPELWLGSSQAVEMTSTDYIK